METSKSQRWKKLVKMNTPNLKWLTSKSLWNPALITKTITKKIIKSSEFKRQMSWIIRSKLCILTKYRIMIAKITVPTKILQRCKKLANRKNVRVTVLSVRNILHAAMTSKKVHSNSLKGNRYGTEKSYGKVTLLTARFCWSKQSVTQQKTWKQ